ncbi:PD-(D/E)XK nuclease superfamily protein [anaerobic digester metagenome]|nr:GxxExxY protein [Lentimicrobiaceae bacterium]
MNKAELNRIHTRIFDAASEIYANLGQGLDTEIYLTCFMHELRLRGLLFKRGVAFPVIYKNIKTNREIIIDLMVENQLLIEVTSLDCITALQMSGMLNKLKIADKRMGILLTFNASSVTEGYRKIMNNT